MANDPNLPGYRPNLTWQPNVPKIEQCHQNRIHFLI
jgi:hypothetical protein